MSEETPNQETPCKPKRNWAVILLAVAIGIMVAAQIRLIRKTTALEKRVTAVENMFAK